MDYEQEYIEAIELAQKAKKAYLTKALEREDAEHLRSIDLGDWSMEERRGAYEQEVLPFWQKFGLAPKQFWFELYGSRDRRMDPRFLPADLYFTEILPYMNDGQQKPGLMNKAYLEYLFSDVKQPRTVLLRTGGIYCDEKRRIIDEDRALSMCLEQDARLFLKVSSGSSGGSGIFVIDPDQCKANDILEKFREAGANFIVQEGIRQHPDLSSLNPISVSTIRVLSLLMEDRVYIESAALRISAPDRPYVKVYDGGVSTEILNDGSLHPRVYSDNGKWFDEGKGLFDESFRVPSMDRIYEEVRRIHPRVGGFKCIGWDFAVDLNRDPVLIEYNVFPSLGCTQITRCKPVFNERTDWILEDYFQRRTWENNHRQDVLIQ